MLSKEAKLRELAIKYYYQKVTPGLSPGITFAIKPNSS